MNKTLLTLMLITCGLFAEEQRLPIETREIEVEQKLHAACDGCDSCDPEEEGVEAKTYYSSHKGVYHLPVNVSSYGDTVELEDGSIWSVCSVDAEMTLNWLTTDTILITQNNSFFSSYRYRLVNLNTGVEVRTNMALGPFYSGGYTRYITFIDYSYNEVVLNDGSLWKICGSDRGMLKQWLVNDTVIIGSNGSWFSQGAHPNILINATIKGTPCVFSKCIN